MHTYMFAKNINILSEILLGHSNGQTNAGRVGTAPRQNSKIVDHTLVILFCLGLSVQNHLPGTILKLEATDTNSVRLMLTCSEVIDPQALIYQKIKVVMMRKEYASAR